MSSVNGQMGWVSMVASVIVSATSDTIQRWLLLSSQLLPVGNVGPARLGHLIVREILEI